MTQPTPTARGAEPFKVNYADDAGKPQVRAFATNSEARAFRETLEPSKDGKPPRLKIEKPEPKDDGKTAEDALAEVKAPPPPEPKPETPPAMPGIVSDATPNPKPVTAPIPAPGVAKAP